MQLRFSKEMKNKIITISLETANFSPEENKYIDDLGEPIVSFDKLYESVFQVKFDKKIKTGFKIIQKFDGTVDLSKAIIAAEQFMEDIETTLQDTMSELRDTHLTHTFIEESGFKDIKY